VKQALLRCPAPVLLVNSGLLARYGLMPLITELETTVGRPGKRPACLAAAADWRHQGLPTIDGVAVPLVITTSTTQWAKAWHDPPRRRLALKNQITAQPPR
jgi:hypothetical protein